MAGQVRVLFFASAKEAAGCPEEVMACEDEGMSSEMFWERLMEKHPAFKALRGSVRIARNHEYLVEGDLIKPGDEAALIPPVSGG